MMDYALDINMPKGVENKHNLVFSVSQKYKDFFPQNMSGKLSSGSCRFTYSLRKRKFICKKIFPHI